MSFERLPPSPPFGPENSDVSALDLNANSSSSSESDSTKDGPPEPAPVPLKPAPARKVSKDKMNGFLKELADLEKKLEALEVESLRQSYLASKSIYDQRAAIVEKIPGFWPAVFEESPADIETYIQARDIPVLQHLVSLELSRFELDENPQKGNPRCIQFAFRFSVNEYFSDETLVKKFWHRRAKDGWSGLVSEPVAIQWKEGKDVTNGQLDSAVKMHRRGHEVKTDLDTGGKKDKSISKAPSFDEDASLFMWFGYHGRNVSAQESAKAVQDEKDNEEILSGNLVMDRTAENGGKSIIERVLAPSENEEDLLFDEVFPAGEELAIAISEDLYPGALKYYVRYQEQESEDEEGDDTSDSNVSSNAEDIRPASKRVKRAG